MKHDISHLKEQLKQIRLTLCDEFRSMGNITHITRKLNNHIDMILVNLFHQYHLEYHGYFCLLALGSYGRRELQLFSDIDILLLHTDTVSEEALNHAQQFIQSCWDIGLEISHQLTNVTACVDLAHHDLSTISSLLDMHLICGRASLMEELRYATHSLHMWRSDEYFFAKRQEQNKRYNKYDESAYNLEPNVKYGPGGLRDLQIIFSIAKRHFGIHKLADGIHSGFISEKEYEELMHCQHFLWRVRFALHLLAQKKEDRLLFDHQVKLARLFGYQDSAQSLGIEQFMKAYFNVIKHVRELNDMLLQWFSETIIHQQKQRLKPLDESFQLSNRYIEVRHPRVFTQTPHALLDIFIWLAKCPEIEDVRASTIRLIRQNLYLINKRFRHAKKINTRFINVFKIAKDPYEILHRMSRYGVLGQYLECFAAVTGQMQYDLFHTYTVEQHTLFVIRNLARFLSQEYAPQFPLCHELMTQISQRHILYLAALFHDIAKGRGGDHSKLGAQDATHFANRHHLSLAEKNLLIFLVEQHLLMSQTAQRQDIYDPQTIAQFCHALPEPEYLDYLYLLTVADICGTNPGLWNAWKDSLLKELFRAAKAYMLKEKNAMDEHSLIQAKQRTALKSLIKKNVSEQTVLSLWATFKNKYFLHESPQHIVKHTQAILNAEQFPVILILPHHTQGGTEVFIYMPHNDKRFTIATTVLSNHHVNILEANITTSHQQFDLDTYIVLDEHNQPIDCQHTIATIQQDLMTHLIHKETIPLLTKRRISQRQAHFFMPPKITFTQDLQRQRTLLFLIAHDRPGLLASISQIFLQENIHLHNAKIVTAGERVEDMFFISNQHNATLTEEEQTVLQQKIIDQLC